MSGRLIYVVGPSGAGKDSVLEYARTRLAADSGIIFARRFITREPAGDGEQHIPVSSYDFERMRIQGYFSLNWNANGLRYGISHEIRTWMSMGFHAVVNGSREYLPTALELFPDALVICITAPVETIRNRLQQRARESGEKIEKRIQRSSLLTLPTGLHVTTIVNDGTLSVAGDRLVQTLLSAKSGIPA